MSRTPLDRLFVGRPTRAAGLTAGAIALALVVCAQAAIAMVEGVAAPDPTVSPAAVASVEATSQPTEAAAQATTAEGPEEFNLSGAGARLIVHVKNTTDLDHAARGRMQLNQIGGPKVGPVNIAIARSTCTDCETLAVALQISVYDRHAPVVVPQNAAVAVNAGCVRCFTMAVAIQYLIPVDDKTKVPADVRRMAHDLNGELKRLVQDKTASVRGRLTRLLEIIETFRQFKAYLDVRLHEETAADSASPDPAASGLPEETDDPAATVSPDATPSATPPPSSGAPTDEPTVQPSPSGSVEPGPEPTAVPPPTPSPSPT